MRTLAVVSRKGGVGKTTIAVHMAVAAEASGRRTVLADLDPQRSSWEWSRLRDGAAPAVTAIRSGALFQIKQAVRRDGLPLLILDTPGTADEHVATGVREADLALLVVRPSVLDLVAAVRSVELLQQLQTPALVVLNQAPSPRGGKEHASVKAAISLLNEYGLPLAPSGLRSRIVFQTAMGRGCAVGEIEPGSAAAREIEGLWAAVKERLWPERIAVAA